MAEFTEALFSIFFVETLINGILLGGVLALLSLGLNLIFRCIWICSSGSSTSSTQAGRGGRVFTLAT